MYGFRVRSWCERSPEHVFVKPKNFVVEHLIGSVNVQIAYTLYLRFKLLTYTTSEFWNHDANQRWIVCYLLYLLDCVV